MVSCACPVAVSREHALQEGTVEGMGEGKGEGKGSLVVRLMEQLAKAAFLLIDWSHCFAWLLHLDGCYCCLVFYE